MILAAGAWRESFLIVKSPRAAVTSSRKHTHMVSAASFSIAVAAAALATTPRLFRKSASTNATQSSRRPRPDMQKTVGPGFRVSISTTLALDGVSSSRVFSSSGTLYVPISFSDLRDRLVDVFEPLIVQSAKSRVSCGEPERSPHYLLVISFDRPFFEERPRLLDGFDRIAR
jgi:hypothetical protein